MPRVDIPNVGTVEFPDTMSGDEISAASQKLYAQATPAPKSAAPADLPRGDVSQLARKHLANELPKVGQEQQDQIVQEAQRKEAIRAAELLPFAVAAPFTAGTSLAVGASIMAGAGLAGGIGREAINATQGGPTKSMGGLAVSLGADALAGAASEVGVRGISKGIGYVGKTLWPKLVAQTAAESTKGARMLEDAYSTTIGSLREEVGPRPVDVGAPMKELYDGLNKIPTGSGKLGARFSGLSEQAKGILSDLESHLVTEGGEISTHQPLDALVQMRGNVNQAAFKGALNTEEASLLHKFTQGLDETIKGAVADSPKAAALYDQANWLGRISLERTTSQQLSIAAVRKFLGARTVGGLVGATVGGYEGSRSGHAGVGATLGAAAVAAIEPQIATVFLRRVLANERAAPIWANAVKLAGEGSAEAAQSAAQHAFHVAGVNQVAKQVINSFSTQPAQPSLSEMAGAQ